MDGRTLLSWLFMMPLLQFARPSALSADTSTQPLSPVGTWNVETVGAPFPAHLYAFHPDGTMMQVNPDVGDPTTSDSAGLGIWQYRHQGGIEGTFKEIRAQKTSGQLTGYVVVSFTLHLSDTTFNGTGKATIYDSSGSILLRRETLLSGKRLQFSHEERER